MATQPVSDDDSEKTLILGQCSQEVNPGSQQDHESLEVPTEPNLENPPAPSDDDDFLHHDDDGVQHLQLGGLNLAIQGSPSPMAFMLAGLVGQMLTNVEEVIQEKEAEQEDDKGKGKGYPTEEHGKGKGKGKKGGLTRAPSSEELETMMAEAKAAAKAKSVKKSSKNKKKWDLVMEMETLMPTSLWSSMATVFDGAWPTLNERLKNTGLPWDVKSLQQFPLKQNETLSLQDLSTPWETLRDQTHLVC